jgi:hypothetical protein
MTVELARGSRCQAAWLSGDLSYPAREFFEAAVVRGRGCVYVDGPQATSSHNITSISFLEQTKPQHNL